MVIFHSYVKVYQSVMIENDDWKLKMMIENDD
jgi:hypothetical protein